MDCGGQMSRLFFICKALQSTNKATFDHCNGLRIEKDMTFDHCKGLRLAKDVTFDHRHEMRMKIIAPSGLNLRTCKSLLARA